MEPIKLTKIDESLLPAHSCLEPSDRCYFLGEYASRRGFNHSDKTSREAAHDPGAKRPKVKDHLNNFIIDEVLKNPKPRAIAIFDDLITSGAHFKAAQTILQKEFPDVPVVGIFVARSVSLPDDETSKQQGGSE